MKNALLFSPSFVGHRQVYIFVFVQILQKLGYTIYIAGNFKTKLNSTFYFDRFKDNENIFRIDTSTFDGDGVGIKIDEFIDLQNKYDIELTVFTEADSHIPLFVSQLKSGKKRLKGKTVGIFLRPFYFYHKLSLIDKARYVKRLHSFWDTDTRFFHEVLNPFFHLLNVSLHLDDFFVSKHRRTVCLPDVFQQFADQLVKEENSSQRLWIQKLDEFKNNNKGATMLLYFGAPQERRGYDVLLKLALDNNACFIHCGLRNDDTDYEYDVNKLREVLETQNRLFETNEYLTDPSTIEYFFKSVNHLILPYRDFLGSSGVMLQALGYNIPVLVPEVGIIGYRVKKYNLGFTFIKGSFEKQFRSFLNTPKESFTKSIEEYMKSQSFQNLNSVLIQALSGESEQ